MFAQLYSPRYTQPIKVYNSVLNKTINLFKVKIIYTVKYIFLCLILKHSQMNLAVDLTYSFDINTVKLKSSSL